MKSSAARVRSELPLAALFGTLHKVIPAVRRIALAQAFVEDHIGVGARSRLSKARLIFRPRINDDLVSGAEAREQPEAIEKLG